MSVEHLMRAHWGIKLTGTKGFFEKDYLRAIDGDIYKFYGENFNIEEIFQSLSVLIEKLEKSQIKKWHNNSVVGALTHATLQLLL